MGGDFAGKGNLLFICFFDIMAGMKEFKVESPFSPQGDQENAIEKLSQGFMRGDKYQTLKGVTGSGKTFTMAKVIEKVQRPTLIISHNKTLSAQLYKEFKNFFPNNAVEYFVSYYDYYQPEAYIPARDLYIEKDCDVNKEIDRMRLSATYSLMERRDVIVVATVSCIYGLGIPALYKEMSIHIELGQPLDIMKFAHQLADLQYERNDISLDRGNFRIRGDTIDVYPPYIETDDGYRISLGYDTIESISRFNVVTGETAEPLPEVKFYPAKHFVVPHDVLVEATKRIEAEMKDRYEELVSQGKVLEAKRLQTRVRYDIEMMKEMGYCSGIENYSGPISGRQRGEPPATLLQYFPDDFLCMIDEAHISVPQIGAMYEGDRARKKNLIDFGFRLPSAFDNRPLKIDEVRAKMNQVIFVTATPRPQEIAKSTQVVEQLIRPTGLLDPIVTVHPTKGQVPDILREVTECTKNHQRCLLLTLTKKMAEDLTDFLLEKSVRVQYIHSEVDTFERVEILKKLREGTIDVLIGINLLREGIDLPEVSFIGILDADKIGFLRSTTSLIQIIGRAARNENGKVTMYADKMSPAMKEAIDETNHRRQIQDAYNKAHGIVPHTIQKSIDNMLEHTGNSGNDEDKKDEKDVDIEVLKSRYNILIKKDRTKLVKLLQSRMKECADNLQYEKALSLRNEIEELCAR